MDLIRFKTLGGILTYEDGGVFQNDGKPMENQWKTYSTNRLFIVNMKRIIPFLVWGTLTVALGDLLLPQRNPTS